MKYPAILSKKLTSKLLKNYSLAGFYDRLTLDARMLGIHKEDLKSELLAKGISVEDGTYCKGGVRLRIGGRESLLSARYLFSSGLVTDLELTPSLFSSYKKMTQRLELFTFPTHIVEELNLKREDKTVDYGMELNTICSDLRVYYKRKVKIFSFDSGVVTGIEVGKKPEVIKVYSRNIKAGTSIPCSRIESYLTGKKIVHNNLRELREFWEGGGRDDSFDSISLAEREYLEITKDPRVEKKLYDHKLLCHHFPYFVARSRLGKNGNYQRDYGCLYRLKPYPCQPSDVFNEGVRKFFNVTEKES